MRLRISSFAPSILNVTQPLRGYADSIGRFKIDDKDIVEVKRLIAEFNIENFNDDVVKDLVSLNIDQLALIMSLLSYCNLDLSLGLIKSYALRTDVTLSTQGFINILTVLEQKGILIAQNTDGVIKYNLQKQILNNVYVKEA